MSLACCRSTISYGEMVKERDATIEPSRNTATIDCPMIKSMFLLDHLCCL